MNAFFGNIAHINRAHCAAQGLPTAVYDRALSEDELHGRLSAEEITLLPRIVAHGRSGSEYVRSLSADHRVIRLSSMTRNVRSMVFRMLVDMALDRRESKS